MTIYRNQLEAVYKLIERPEAWTKGVTARNSEGDVVCATGAHAVCWCVIGAFMRCGLGCGWEPATRALMGDAVADALLASESSGGIAEFNDAPSAPTPKSSRCSSRR